MFELKPSGRFKKDMKKISRSGADLSKIEQVFKILRDGKTLPQKYKDHSLKGNWTEHRECHIEPDWLLIYRTDKKNNRIELVRTGSHSELFK